MLHNGGGSILDESGVIQSETGARIARALLLQNGHGDLGQVIEREVIKRAAPEQLQRCFLGVAPEGRSVGDANHAVAPLAPFSCRRSSRFSTLPVGFLGN